MEPAVRLIRSGALAPALNLALDEALLRSGVETFRLYAWDPPGLSLGYFQKANETAVPKGFTLVRRPTGGGAIAHTGEVTVSWIGRRQRVDAAYAVMNKLVEDALSNLGITTTRGQGEPEAAPRGMCFDHHTCYDLMVGEKKIFGSAQRRGGDRFLLHGTLVVAKNPAASGAISVAEALDRSIAHSEIEQAILDAAPWPLAPGSPTPEEWARAHALVEKRYASKAWTLRR